MLSHDAPDYANQMNQLMPRGLAWSRVKDGPNAMLIAGMAEEPARVEARAIYLALYEFFAQSTRELLPEWEKEYGLPDECTRLGVTYEERIENLLRKIRTIGGQSISYFISVAKALGIEITIDEFRPFRVGRNRVGDRIYDRDWLFVFRVNLAVEKIYRFRAGRNSVGDRLRYWRRNEIIECIINKLKPAHTLAIFGYAESFTFFDGAGNAILRDNIADGVVDPILDLGENGEVYIRPDVSAGSENETMTVAENGDIIVRD